MTTTTKAGRWARLAAVTLALTACAGPDDGDTAAADADPTSVPDSVEAYVRPTADGGDLVQGDTLPGHPSWTEQDWEVLNSVASWAWENGVDRLPVGERVALIGKAFVGTDYIPQTLDPEGAERLVVNLRALDCVTFVENALAFAHFVRMADPSILQRRDDAVSLYGDILTDIRYRSGTLDGYTSRLHYFSEWISDNVDKGYVTDVTADLGGVRDDEPIDFMTEHRDAYRQLAGDADFARVGEIEARLSGGNRAFIPEAQVATAQQRFEDGDVIALTSTLEGLDVAHTGLAVWEEGAPHLLNAPLVGKQVDVSEKSIADRLAGISSQDGLIVARPRETDAIRGRFSGHAGLRAAASND